MLHLNIKSMQNVLDAHRANVVQPVSPMVSPHGRVHQVRDVPRADMLLHESAGGRLNFNPTHFKSWNTRAKKNVSVSFTLRIQSPEATAGSDSAPSNLYPLALSLRMELDSLPLSPSLSLS